MSFFDTWQSLGRVAGAWRRLTSHTPGSYNDQKQAGEDRKALPRLGLYGADGAAFQ